MSRILMPTRTRRETTFPRQEYRVFSYPHGRYLDRELGEGPAVAPWRAV